MKTFICILVFVLAAILFAPVPHDVCDSYAQGAVTSVGGCDEYGYCGVALDGDKYMKNVRFPVVGMQIRQCVDSHVEWH